MSDFYFDPNEYDGSYLITPDDYAAEIIGTEITQPRSGNGHMLRLTWKILTGGEYEGRLVSQMLCYDHSNPQTQDIARKHLRDICAATGITEQITDPQIFLFRTAKVRVVIEKDKYGRYDDQNRIRRIMPLTDSDGESLEATLEAGKETNAKPSKPTGNSSGAAPWKRSGA